jgi:hypothetical protein
MDQPESEAFTRWPILRVALTSGLNALLVFRFNALKGDELVASWQGKGSSTARDQSAMMQPRRADVGAAMIAHCQSMRGCLSDSSAFDLPAADYAVPDDQTRCQDHGNQSIRRTFRT